MVLTTMLLILIMIMMWVTYSPEFVCQRKTHIILDETKALQVWMSNLTEFLRNSLVDFVWVMCNLLIWGCFVLCCSWLKLFFFKEYTWRVWQFIYSRMHLELKWCTFSLILGLGFVFLWLQVVQCITCITLLTKFMHNIEWNNSRP